MSSQDPPVLYNDTLKEKWGENPVFNILDDFWQKRIFHLKIDEQVIPGVGQFDVGQDRMLFSFAQMAAGAPSAAQNENQEHTQRFEMGPTHGIHMLNCSLAAGPVSQAFLSSSSV